MDSAYYKMSSNMGSVPGCSLLHSVAGPA